MSRMALTLGLTVLALWARPLLAEDPGYPPGPAANSWRSMSTHAPELRPLVGEALAAIGRRTPLSGIFRAEQQFLGAAMAYRLILVLADGSKWRVTLLPGEGGGVRASEVELVP